MSVLFLPSTQYMEPSDRSIVVNRPRRHCYALAHKMLLPLLSSQSWLFFFLSLSFQLFFRPRLFLLLLLDCGRHSIPNGWSIPIWSWVILLSSSPIAEPSCYPTEHFAAFGPKNPPIDVSELLKIQRSTDFEATSLWNVPSESSLLGTFDS